MARHQDRTWYPLAIPLDAYFAREGTTLASKVIAFSFDGDEPIYLTQHANIVSASQGWQFSLPKP
jgi:hypothetical protein